MHATATDWVELPGHARWYFLDDRPGLERFVLGWTTGPAPSVATIQGELVGLSRALSAVRRPPAADATEGLQLRGLGGTREAPRPTARGDESSLMTAIEGVFRAHYDQVRYVEFKHR